jgi:hypothetical protein
MSFYALLGIGLLILLANLLLCAALSPSLTAGEAGPADRIRAVWRILWLALIQIGAWALLMHEAGLTEGVERSLEEALSAFVFVESSIDGLDHPIARLIALNGLLFVPVSLLCSASPRVLLPPGGFSAPVELKPPVAERIAGEQSPGLSATVSMAKDSQNAKAAPLQLAQQPLPKPDTSRPFRGSVPPLIFPPALEFSDGLAAEEARYAGPPPPAIRFHTPAD